MRSVMNPIRCALLAAIVVATIADGAAAQLLRNQAVGGVMVDAQGVLSSPETTELGQLRDTWQAGLEVIPAELDAYTDLRFVSLRELEREIAQAREAGQELPDAVKYLAGLQRVRYVLVYPEQGDIVLAGPAEGWRIDSLGNPVGATTGRPVLLLDDLMAALRAAESSNRTGISCSIDPSQEGLQRMQALSGQLSARNGPQGPARQMEEALGQQVITVTGVPATSHLARVLVAADFRMKRLAMGFEPAPIDGLPSFLEMMRVGSTGMQNSLPRWWLAPNYEPLQRDTEGLAWELRGQGVKCMTEQDFLTDDGRFERSIGVDPTAQRWSDRFTERFDELAREDSTFGQLRNVMDLAVVGALLVKEGLLEVTGLEIPQLTDIEPLDVYNAPRHVASQTSFIKKRGNWIITASGGVQIYPWQVADQVAVTDQLVTVRDQQVREDSNRWWW